MRKTIAAKVKNFAEDQRRILRLRVVRAVVAMTIMVDRVQQRLIS